MLYVVGTPIGNLADITLRALEVLKSVDVIAAEDTRHSGNLLRHFEIRKPLISYHEHNERERAAEIVERLAGGDTLALVSDAGTPAINDPGFRLVRACIERGVRVVPIPGATALIAALIASGMPTDEFFFGGFLPSRSTARRTRLTECRALDATLIFYESPHRLPETLADAREILGEREAAIARELTKLHEEIRRGRLSELAIIFARTGAETSVRGEIVMLIDRAEIIVEGQNETRAASILERVAALEREGRDARTALRTAARELGLTRDEAYRRLAAERSAIKAARKDE